MKRWILAGSLLLALGGTGAWFYFQHPSVPPIPDVPPGVTDPAAIRVVESKRAAAVATPYDGAAWGELGMAFDAAEQSSQAMACYETARNLNPDDPRWPYLLAKLLGRRERESDASQILQLYREVLTGTFPSPAHQLSAELTLAEILVERGQIPEATTLYQQVRSADSTNPQATYFLAVQAMNRGDLTAAVTLLTSHGRNPYTQKKASAALAAIYRRKNQTAYADGYEYASSLLPPDRGWPDPFLEELSQYRRGPKVLINDVTQLEANREYPQAAIVARKLVDLYPTAEHQLVYGRTMVNLKEYDAAVAALEDALLADPTLVMSHASLAMAELGKAERLESLGSREPANDLYQKAIRSFQKAVELKADYAPGYFYQAKALIALGQYDRAEPAVRSCISLRPEEWEAYLILGDILAAKGKKAEAIQAVEQAVRLANPRETRPRQRLAELQK